MMNLPTALSPLLKRFFGRLLILPLAAPLLASGAVSSIANIHETTLKNGMRVIVKEDHRAPVVASMVWYRAGSIDEFNGTTGVAHVLEHMMFKGTKAVPGGEFSRRIAAAGGKDNAFTGKDYTAYFQQLHKSELPLALKLEADRMQNLILTAKEFGKEINVVMEERRWRTDDQPHALVDEQLMAAAFREHPYRAPVIGWMNDLQNMSVADARDWYKRWYTPNNAILVVVGDVEAKRVFELATNLFGDIKTRPLPGRKPQSEPEQDGTRRIVVKAPAELPYIMMGYHVPVLHDAGRDWQPYALEILGGVLDGHEAARLNRELVREQRLASTAGASYDSVARGPGMFLIDGTPSEGKSVNELETGIREQIRKIVDEGVTEEELKRVKAQVIASEVFQRDSMFYQAMQIGSLETAGVSYKSLDTQLQKLKEVTAEQVQAVAKKYLTDDNLTVAVLEPQPLEQKRAAQPPKGLHHAN